MDKKRVYLTNDEELKLIKEYLEGRSSAFTPLFQKYQMIFFTNLYKWYKNAYKDPEEVNDMAIEFLGRISTKLHLYNPKIAKFNTWMMNSMKNYMKECWAAKNRHKRKGTVEPLDRHQNIIDSTPNAIKSLERSSHRELIKRMLESLGPEDTKIFHEIIVKGETQEETRKKLGLKRSTMSYRFQRMLKRLEKFRPDGY